MDNPARNAIVPLGRQKSRPEQPIHPHAADDVDMCTQVVRPFLHNAPVAVLTYLTDIENPWILGLSAAHHRVPLVWAGKGMRWSGVSVKLGAARRALQLLHAARPGIAVVFADGADTFVANPLSSELAQRIQATAHQGRVLVSSECNSWPRCYSAEYARHSAFQMCRSRRTATCYPNSGAYAGGSGTLLDFLSALRSTAEAGSGAEHLDDQAALHRLYLARYGGGGAPVQAPASLASTEHLPPWQGAQAVSGPLEVAVDDEGAVFLGMHACKGSGALHSFRARGTTFSTCHTGAHDPFASLTANGSTLSHTNVRAGTRRTPFLAHASGTHDRMGRALFGTAGVYGRPYPEALRKPAARQERWWRTYARPGLLDHPVLLVDAAKPADRLTTREDSTGSKQAGLTACTVTTLRALLCGEGHADKNRSRLTEEKDYRC